MALPRFFVDSELVSDAIVVGAEITLSAEESRHATSSRRLTAGSRVELITGHGLLAIALIQTVGKQVVVRVESVQISEPIKPALHIAVAVPKGDRMRTMLDMMSQLGVSSFTPLECEFSVTRAQPKHIDKWRRYLIEACKQSANPYLPTINPACRPAECVDIVRKQANPPWIGYADQSGQEFPRETLSNDICVLIGPEGGFSKAETTMFAEKGVEACKFGDFILRIETAAVAATAFIRLLAARSE